MNGLNLALDTNAYRALDDGNSRLIEQVQKASIVGLPITVLGEIYFGIFGGNQQERNTSELNRFLGSARVEILRIDENTARIFGEVSAALKRIGRPIQQNDIWIAALCKQYGYTLATADGDFLHVLGLEVFNF